MGTLGVGRWSQSVGKKEKCLCLCPHAAVAVGGPNVAVCDPTWQNLPLPTGILWLFLLLTGNCSFQSQNIGQSLCFPLGKGKGGRGRLLHPPVFQRVMVLSQGSALLIPTCCSSASQAKPRWLWSCDHLCGAVTISVLPMCTPGWGWS